MVGDQRGGRTSRMNVLDGMVEMWRDELNSANDFLHQRSRAGEGKNFKKGSCDLLSLEDILGVLKKISEQSVPVLPKVNW